MEALDGADRAGYGGAYVADEAGFELPLNGGARVIAFAAEVAV